MIKYILSSLMILYCLCMQGQTKTDPVQNLKKYSYMVVIAKFTAKYNADETNVKNYQIDGFATCFFIRRNKHLFLCTAYHVATNYDVILMKEASDATHLLIRYSDHFNKRGILAIDLKDTRKKFAPRNFISYPDASALDISDSYNDPNILSIENYINQPCLKKGSISEKYVAYGFQSRGKKIYSSTGPDYIEHAEPILYEGKKADSSRYKYAGLKDMDSLYTTTSPKSEKGLSGSPLFLVLKSKNKTCIEFAGVSSTKSDKFNTASFVKTDRFLKLITEGK